MLLTQYRGTCVCALCLVLSAVATAQTLPTATDQSETATLEAIPAVPPAAAVLPTPAMTGPLAVPLPAIFDAGSFGKIAVNGILNGFSMWQGNHVSGDASTRAALSNGQIFIQKTDGWFQFYLQAGAYTLPSLATPFLATDKTLTNFYGPLPQAFIKL